jgi:quercetin dioxygenase-like cupin family protein
MSYLQRLKQHGKRVVGVGAPMKASTLLNYCHIGTETLDYLTEVNPLKIGKLSPGTHIPIVAEEEMFKDAPDYGLLLSWNFADEIIRKLRARGFKGGFIHPIPQFHVINEVVSFSDERGVIVDVLTDESVEHVNYITMAKGSVRGNHFHKQSVHYNYVLHGRIRFLRKMPYGPVRGQCVGEGELVFTGMNERHALKALEDSELMVFTRGPRGGRNYESDTFRLPEGECLV